MDGKFPDNTNGARDVRSAPPLPDGLGITRPQTVGAVTSFPIPLSQKDTRVGSDNGDEIIDVVEDSQDSPKLAAVAPPKGTYLPKRFGRAYWHHKLWTLPLTVLAIVAAILAIPAMRYPVLALGLTRQFTVAVIDGKTNTPVSGASVTLDGKTVTTDSSGNAELTARVGRRILTVSKKYYNDTSEAVFVGINTQHNSAHLQLVATGRQVPVKVINRITGEAIADAELKAVGTEAKTDADGQATIVLPASGATQDATISASGYNDLGTNVTVTSLAVDANTFALTPSGRVYFLSNLSGKIDVVSANLDGTDRKTLLPGTGSEDPNNTLLLATSDWKYLALLSKRDGGSYAKLFVITTDSGHVTTIDDNAANFTPVGWSGHFFVYLASYPAVQSWEPKASSIKSYSADSANTATLADSDASGTSLDDAEYENMWDTAFLDGNLVYTTTWYHYPGSLAVDGQQNSLMMVGLDGSGKRTLKTVDAAQYYFSNLKLANPTQAYFGVYSNASNTANYYRLDENGSVTQSSTITSDAVNKAYPTYLVSPSGKATFWAEARDGKNTLFVGDGSGGSGQQIAALSDYTPYAWFSDSYLLMQKGGSELYIMPAGGGTALKVSDYYKPQYSFAGGTYGGF